MAEQVTRVVTGTTREFLAATAGAAGALTGLLFVALSVAPRQRQLSVPAVILDPAAGGPGGDGAPPAGT